ncbi:dedicator of cytokinesis protein 5-like, partial [Cynoglossus semilaevis]|uniref:dedicator of cytokinesis protein 5-like n=1 Tax=Cynoglossus semilaevis TaxID=244447 RepID=UPI000D629D70
METSWFFTFTPVGPRVGPRVGPHLSSTDMSPFSPGQKKQAQFYENIMHAMRPQPEYFAVGYYGLGFPSFLRNKMFIFRGKEYEWLEDFSLKLLSQFPSAVRMTSTAPPGDNICNSSGQCILFFFHQQLLKDDL